MTKLSSQVRKKDLEREFGRYGKIRNTKLKRGYAFIEYYHKDDAKVAIRELNKRAVFSPNQRIVVEEARGSKGQREYDRDDRRRYSRRREHDRDRSRGHRDYYKKRGKTGPKETDECFNCGKLGHWANECPNKKE